MLLFFLLHTTTSINGLADIHPHLTLLLQLPFHVLRMELHPLFFSFVIPLSKSPPTLIVNELGKTILCWLKERISLTRVGIILGSPLLPQFLLLHVAFIYTPNLKLILKEGERTAMKTGAFHRLCLCFWLTWFLGNFSLLWSIPLDLLPHLISIYTHFYFLSFSCGIQSSIWFIWEMFRQLQEKQATEFLGCRFNLLLIAVRNSFLWPFLLGDMKFYLTINR